MVVDKKEQELPAQPPGRGMIVCGIVDYREVVDFEEDIGLWVNQETLEEVPTTVGIVHYNKNAQAHIIPANPKIMNTDRSEKKSEASVQTIVHNVMHGWISPNVREIYLDYVKERKDINIYIYFDTMPTDDELEEIGVIESEMMCEFTVDYTLNYLILRLPYPFKSDSKGLCLYRRYEPNPEPQAVNRNNLILAGNQAMLGRIHRNLRMLNTLYDEKRNAIKLLAYFVTPPSDNQINDIEAIMAQMRGHFSQEISWKKEIITYQSNDSGEDDEIGLYSSYMPPLLDKSSS